MALFLFGISKSTFLIRIFRHYFGWKINLTRRKGLAPSKRTNAFFGGPTGKISFAYLSINLLTRKQLCKYDIPLKWFYKVDNHVILGSKFKSQNIVSKINLSNRKSELLGSNRIIIVPSVYLPNTKEKIAVQMALFSMEIIKLILM